MAHRISTLYRWALGLLCACTTASAADGRAGIVEWSDGHKQVGAISVSEGKSLRVFSGDKEVSITLDEVKTIRITPEKERMWEGFYFPNAGQATQVKTGEVYPIRYLKAEVTLGTGQVVTGHLATTVFYIESDDGTAVKVVLPAKQTGANGESLAELLYPTTIRLDAGTASTGSVLINLSSSGLTAMETPVILTQPDLSPLAAQQVPGKSAWIVPAESPGKIIFSIQAVDGIHVAWPTGAYVGNQVMKIGDLPLAMPPADVDPLVRLAVKVGLRDLRDFYDARNLLGSFSGNDPTDIYSLVMMKRLAKDVDGGGDSLPSGVIPWSVVLLRWKYDADANKVTLLNRAMLAIGRIDPHTPEPKVFRDTSLSSVVARSSGP